ncbi:IS200/IS605 family transposase [Pollutibacter soli]|uniref:IS200/IS605 family transposase n=1 Tax=Pollutibacter soli TaxID=3034157 RepID=UPI003013BFE5
MPNTNHQIYLQFVFAVKFRYALIPKQNKEEIHKYLTGLVQHRNAKMLAVHCMPDHCHLFVGYHPAKHIPDFVKEVKNESNEFINQRRLSRGKFAWQEGYGVFSYSRSQIDSVIKYVNNQEIHHRKKTFREEYLQLLQKFNVDFDEKYLFDFITV